MFFYIISDQYNALNYAKYLYEFLNSDIIKDDKGLETQIDKFDIEFR